MSEGVLRYWTMDERDYLEVCSYDKPAHPFINYRESEVVLLTYISLLVPFNPDVQFL